MAMDEQGLENAAILLMSLGEEHASEVFKHLAPKEVQRLGETIARMKAVSRERVENVLEDFEDIAAKENAIRAGIRSGQRLDQARAGHRYHDLQSPGYDRKA